MADYEVPAAAIEHKLTVKGSRFIACVKRVAGVAAQTQGRVALQVNED